MQGGAGVLLGEVRDLAGRAHLHRSDLGICPCAVRRERHDVGCESNSPAQVPLTLPVTPVSQPSHCESVANSKRNAELPAASGVLGRSNHAALSAMRCRRRSTQVSTQKEPQAAIVYLLRPRGCSGGGNLRARQRTAVDLGTHYLRATIRTSRWKGPCCC